VSTEDAEVNALAQLCSLLQDPAAPYAFTLDAVAGDTYEGDGAPWPPLTVIESEKTPIREVLYHRQIVSATPAPGSPPVHICLSRMVGRLEDGREVPLGEVCALPAELVRAAEAAEGGRCSACGVAVRGADAVEHNGEVYHKGCLG
jgi:hypothetical protein